MTLEEYSRRGDKMARACMAFLSKFNVDFFKVSPDGRYMVENWGCKIKFVEEKDNSFVEEHAVKVPEDWEKLEVLDPRRDGRLGEQLKALSILSERIGKRLPFLETVFSPMTLATFLGGTQRVSEDMKLHSSALRKGLETISDTVIDFGRACLDQSSTGIFYAIKVAERGVLTAEQFNEFGARYDLRVLDALSDAPMIVLHLHSEKPKNKLLMDKIVEYPAHAINWWDRGSALNLRCAKKKFGKRFCLIGGIDHKKTLPYGTQAEIEKEVKDAIEAAGDDGGFILGPGCQIQSASDERLSAALNAATKYGTRAN